MSMMLNNFYKMVDESLSKYQVYKLSSVNDSHMVVSGLQQGEEEQHAAQVTQTTRPTRKPNINRPDSQTDGNE